MTMSQVVTIKCYHQEKEKLDVLQLFDHFRDANE